MSWIFDLSSVVTKFLDKIGQDQPIHNFDFVHQRFLELQANIRDVYAIPIRAWLLENLLWDEIYVAHYPALAIEKFLTILLGGSIPQEGYLQIAKHIENWGINHNNEIFQSVQEFSQQGRNPLRDHVNNINVDDFDEVGTYINAVNFLNQSGSKTHKSQNLHRKLLHLMYPELNNVLDDLMQSSNRKVDLAISFQGYPNLLFSIKSFIETNSEVNIGSLPPKLLFTNIVNPIPSERTDLGSGVKFANYLNGLTEIQRNAFYDRARLLISIIYYNIHLITFTRFQQQQKIEVQIIDNNTLVNTLTSLVTDANLIRQYGCRIEGNALRFQKSAFGVAQGNIVTIDINL